MFVLDTDHLSLLERSESVHAQRIWERLAACGDSQIMTTIITYEEQTRGWLSFLGRARTIREQVNAYELLRRHLDNYKFAHVLDFDQQAAWNFERLLRLRLRMSTMDLKIAAIVLAKNATLISRNLRHFQQVPGLKVEDWTV
jgi:tRNA(fMet)-specific endonuclease VapC